jgi:hypothetical protein
MIQITFSNFPTDTVEKNTKTICKKLAHLQSPMPDPPEYNTFSDVSINFSYSFAKNKRNKYSAVMRTAKERQIYISCLAEDNLNEVLQTAIILSNEFEVDSTVSQDEASFIITKESASKAVEGNTVKELASLFDSRKNKLQII